MARAEATAESDLDVFIVDCADESLGDLPFSKVESHLLLADLIRASADAAFPPFSRDGAFLEVHRLTDIVSRTGRSDDDYTNSFTARLLLVLESRAILNPTAHDRAKSSIIESYWRDYEDSNQVFLPVFLVNDVMRYWKTVCLNYEADRNAGVPSGLDATAWRDRNRLKNVKLKFSRLWTCHSTIAHLLYRSAGGRSVTPEDAQEMLSMTPLERLGAIAETGHERERVAEVVRQYSWFLENVPGARADALQWVEKKQNWTDARARGSAFGQAMSSLLLSLGEESALYRFLLV